MKTRLLVVLTVAALGFAACNGGFKKGPAGLLYNIHNDVKGDSIAEGDFISLQVIAKTEGDSVMYNTYDFGKATQTLVPKPTYDGDLFYAIKMLTKGDSATIKIDLDSAAAKGQPKPQGIKGKYLIYTVKIEEVIHKDTANQQAFQAKIQAFFKTEGDKAKSSEVVKVQKYIDDNKLKVEKLPSGLQIAIVTAGKGEIPVKGDSVDVNYVGQLVSGKIFDTSRENIAKLHKDIYNPQRPYAPLAFTLGKGSSIPGFEEAILHMKKGEKAIAIIPSSLGYGEQGMPGSPIGPFTPLVFELELMNVIHKDSVAVIPSAMKN
ncbi:MAG: FKBP-type peptidyl-prolyl cis-trans isomerase [Bacteroidetes bacterium]|nr:FKBP-type peptidyl-prolyl cis-trans isomerase [Bacteroidota bacterium]MBU1373431.1 FKBP-type peptidyl-prolyl cis-trans isomerase [Bacteroidota bacterium]MBU1484159.1 FKBP-type peptidyl-prolyl cis-trans isomerase [Bacteroidota bacterium]MBU1759998.1 FKBP-type peptidyl-prolyl cis-trans isomerase [Bacteroidota bacterium]MBU2266736.1 FKBP-type peptidyl-prolyl cis-trans isomerase [Bacteroidota bacterium]